MLAILKSKLSFKDTDLTDTGMHSSGPIYANKILCPCCKFVWSKFREMRWNKHIELFWVFNGTRIIKLHANSVRIIIHIGDQRNHFPSNPILEDDSYE